MEEDNAESDAVAVLLMVAESFPDECFSESVNLFPMVSGV